MTSGETERGSTQGGSMPYVMVPVPEEQIVEALPVPDEQPEPAKKKDEEEGE